MLERVANLDELGKELPRATKDSVEVVYIIQEHEDGNCKIGHSTQSGVKARVRQLQSGNPRQLAIRVLLDGGAWLELALHEYFASHRLRGEWFSAEALRKWFPEVL